MSGGLQLESQAVADLNLADYTTVWTETFDADLGRVDHTWGRIWVHDGMATVSSWAGEQWPPSGMMQLPSGPTAGQGYGLYTVTAEFNDNPAPGGFITLWPADDVWNWELDIVERDFNGRGYSTIHWGGASGHDQSITHYLPADLDVSQPHTYGLLWEQDYLALWVDGKLIWAETEHVPADFAHGGVNTSFGVGEQPAWAGWAQQGDNWVDVYEMSYAVPKDGAAPPSGGTGGTGSPPDNPPDNPPDSAPGGGSGGSGGSSGGSPDAIDWNVIAARVTAYHDATGIWADPGPGWQPGGSSSPGDAPPPAADPEPGPAPDPSDPYAPWTRPDGSIGQHVW